MGDNKDSNGSLLLGITLGAILVFILLTRKQQAFSAQPNWQPMDIPRVEDIKPIQSAQITQTDPQLIQMTSQLNNATSQLNNATSQLNNATSQLEQAVYKLQETVSTISRIQTYQQIQQTQSQIKQDNEPQLKPSLPNTVYKNDEKLEIKRGSDGRIKSLNIIRDVQKNN